MVALPIHRKVHRNGDNRCLKCFTVTGLPSISLYTSFGQFKSMKYGEHLVAFITDRDNWSTKAISTSKVNAAVVASIFLKICVANFGIPSKLLFENVSQFDSQHFVAIFSTMRRCKTTTTE